MLCNSTRKGQIAIAILSSTPGKSRRHKCSTTHTENSAVWRCNVFGTMLLVLVIRLCYGQRAQAVKLACTDFVHYSLGVDAAVIVPGCDAS